MRPLLFQRGRVTLHAYPTMLYVGLVIGMVAGHRAAIAAGLDPVRVLAATYLLLVPALVGGRLAHVVGHWRTYRRQPSRIWSRSEGGAAMYGGLGLVTVASLLVVPAVGVPLGAFWDVTTFTILVGMIFTRVGCLLTGCCAGRITASRWALVLPNRRGEWARRVPTQLLEGAWATLLLVGAVALFPYVPFAGALFLYLLAGYGMGRLLLESSREQVAGKRLTIHHGVSVALVIGAVAALAAAWPR